MNHAFASSARPLDLVALLAATQEVVKATFGELLIAYVVGDTVEVVRAVDPKDCYLTIWLKAKRTIEFRQGFVPGRTFGHYLQWVVQTNLAARFGGRCSDEGTGSRTWPPKPDEFPNFHAFWEELRLPSEGVDLLARVAFDRMWERELEFLPDDVRAFVLGHAV